MLAGTGAARGERPTKGDGAKLKPVRGLNPRAVKDGDAR
jgi:hypothetical protein